jgi:4-amino-4-deoxy-L-arabinose transferase-like glycosyltransferase
LPEDDENGPPTVQQFGRAPLYPLFLAPLTLTSESLREGRMPADVPAAVKIAQAVVGAIGVWFIGAIAWRAAGDARVGVAAAAIASVYPPLVWICAYALSEALFCTLALAAVWVLGRELDSPGVAARARVSSARVLVGGMLTGLATLTRPQMLFFLPFAAALAWRRRPRFAAIVVAGALLMVLPWTVRNAITYGRFVLIASEGGVTFWTGNHPEAIGEGDLAANPHLKELNREFRARHANLTEEQLESIYYREALDFIVHDPIHWLGLEARKLFYTWVPIGPSYRLHSPLYFWLSVASYVLVLPFAVIGTIRLWRDGRRPWTLWLLACSAVLVCLVFFPQERFRIPVIDPTLIVCAAALGSRRVSRSDARASEI